MRLPPLLLLAVLAAGCSEATPVTLDSLVAAARPGDTVTLDTGDYGTWEGTDKPITLRGAPGELVTMRIAFGTGDRNFTLEDVAILGGKIGSSASDPNAPRNITIRDATFTDPLLIQGVRASNILLERTVHNEINWEEPGDLPGRITVGYHREHTGVTIRACEMRGGSTDGVQAEGGVNVIGCRFIDLVPNGPNHTDNIQLVHGAKGSVIRGNLIQADAKTQGITAYQGPERAVIEYNVVDIRRFAGIELFSDDGSVVRHNTVVHHPPGCDGGSECGGIDITRLLHQEPSRGTVVVDNIATYISVKNGSTLAERHHNMVRRYRHPADLLGNPVFAGGASPSSYAGFALVPGSPGEGAASDATDIGARP